MTPSITVPRAKLGSRTRFHFVPSRRRMNPFSAGVGALHALPGRAVPVEMSVRYAVPLSTYPAAHALPGEIWTTPCSSLRFVSGFGLVTWAHELRTRLRTRVFVPLEL